MLEAIDQIDKQTLLYVNGHHTHAWDGVMVFFSAKLVWIPLYAILLGYLWWRFRKKVLAIIVVIALLITAADQFASTLVKPRVARLRPCHDPDVAPALYLAKGCGGTYGFISSHAANTFAIACFISLLLKIRWVSFFVYFWAGVVSYSRIYLGAHYPGDIIGGGLAGILLGVFFYQGYVYFEMRWTNINQNKQPA